MQKGQCLQFCCQKCGKAVQFSIFQLKKNSQIACDDCKQTYDFSDETLQRQLKKFESLCLQIQDSEEILSNTSIGIFLGGSELKIPYKLLLTRLNSTLDLMMGSKPLSITFRIEPAKEILSLENYLKSC